MNVSGVEWLYNGDDKGLTCNPVVGCSRISPGCGGGHIRGPNGEQGGCWAEELVSTRMSKNPKLPMYADLARPDGGWSGVVKTVPERLKEIVALGRRKKGSRVFVCDLSDLFHDKVPFDFIVAVFGAMACAPNHLFYVLTKRPERALEWAEWVTPNEHTVLYDHLFERMGEGISNMIALERYPTTWQWPLPNVAFGVTVEDRRYGVPRLELARKFPAKYHWASVEPQLESLGDVDFSGLDLIVNGGEAGPGSRPFDLQWAREVRDSARKAGALYFMKQAGDFVLDKGIPVELGKKGNDLNRLPEDLRIRENVPMPTITP